MARQLRLEKIGFHHIINRGVERRTIFIDNEDYKKFLEIIDESRETYAFTIHSFCLMSNHYHFLLELQEENLSLIMRQINSRYSIYFNNKYKRVGPLWQGRFKSFFVYDENYLTSVIKYIEHNPIKANLTQEIGQFPWAMSSKKVNLECLDFELIDSIDLQQKLNTEELQKIDALFTAKLKIVDNKILKKTKKEIYNYFEKNIATAIDPRTIRLKKPDNLSMVAFLAKVQNINVKYKKEEKIVIDERTGTVVSGIGIQVSPIIITHGDITIKIEPRKVMPKGKGQVNMGDGVKIAVNKNELNIKEKNITIANITRALHKLGASPKDIISIIENIKRAGAINAKLEII